MAGEQEALAAHYGAKDAEQERDDAGRFSAGSGASKLTAKRSPKHDLSGMTDSHLVYNKGRQSGFIRNITGSGYSGYTNHPTDRQRTIYHKGGKDAHEVLSHLARKHAEALGEK